MNRVGTLLLAVALCGCAVTTKSIRTTYVDYNETIEYNQSQQMLLNLVRLKYRESPLFLKVGALSASYSFQIDGSASLGRAGRTNSRGIGVGSSYASRPTITYTPLEGDTFVKQVLSEIDADAFLLLFRSGWPITALGHVMIERIGRDVNNPGDPTYERFGQVLVALQEAQDVGELDFERVGEDVVVIVVTDRVDLGSDERLPAKRELRLPVQSVQLRSLLDVMFSLAKNTEVPETHHEQVKHSAGNGWIRIRSSAGRPGDALVAVEHNGYWFRIDRTDIRSKDTFALLKLLFQMQAGDIPAVQPLLTLPVAQP